MTHILDDPAEFAEEALDGFVQVHPRYVHRVPGEIVRRTCTTSPTVAVIIGGGSGHYPARAGLAGQELADGAVVGNILTPPFSDFAYSAGRQAHSGAGVTFS